ncbi:MAG: phage replisome organizer [Clostridium butyricum]|nr:phage replisome organizer [Clostridium butyricum]
MKEIKNIKVRSDMYYDTKFKIIDTKPLRDTIHYVWMRVLTLAGIVNRDGELYLSKNIPYTNETLALEFNRDAEVVKMSLEVLIELEMIAVNEHNVYIVKNFMKHQNIKTKNHNTSDIKCDNMENKKEDKELCLEENSEETQENDTISAKNKENINRKNIELESNDEVNNKIEIANKSNVKDIEVENKKFTFDNNVKKSKFKNETNKEEKKRKSLKGNKNTKGRIKSEQINMEDDDKYIVKILDEPDIREGDEVIMSWAF